MHRQTLLHVFSINLLIGCCGVLNPSVVLYSVLTERSATVIEGVLFLFVCLRLFAV